MTRNEHSNGDVETRLSPNPVNRMYGVARAMNRMADLMDAAEDPLAEIMRLLSEDMERCAAWVDDHAAIMQAHADRCGRDRPAEH